MDEEHKLTKKEKRELRRLEWQEKARIEQRNAKIKRFAIWTGVIIVFLIVGFVLFESVTSSPPTNQTIKIAPVSSRDITTGNPKAKITLIEYSACAAYHSLVDQLLNNYKNKIFYAYRMFPLTNSHPNSFVAAQAAYAAYKQGEFIAYSNLLFQNQTAWGDLTDPTPAFLDYAKSLKLDVAKFQADMNSEQTKKYVKTAENEALSEGIFQTPSFFINGNLITNPNSYNDFKKLIDNALQK
jgi:protein-disulfide isomerase